MKRIKIPESLKRENKKGTPANASSERGEFVGKFSDRINSQPGTLVKISYPRMGKMISHLSLQDLHYLWKRCDESNNFARCFRGLLKTYEQ